MREIDTDALEGVAESLGIGNPATATRHALFDDDNLQQALDVSRIVGRTTVRSAIFAGVIENVHAAADSTELTAVDLYAPLPGTPGNACSVGFNSLAGDAIPDPIPDAFDWWLLTAQARVASGAAANFAQAGLQLVFTTPDVAFGCSTTLAAGADVGQYIVAYDGTTSTGTPLDLHLTELGTGKITKSLGIRVPRNVQLRWVTRNQNALAIDVEIRLILGLFRRGFQPTVSA